MKKITTRFLLLLLMVSVSATSVPAASVPATEPVTTSEPVPAAAKAEPSHETVKSAVDELNNLSKAEKKSRLKEAKKAFKEYKKKKKEGMMDEDARLILLVILAILLPPLAVFLKEEELNYKTVLALLLCLLAIFSFAWWLIPVLYALLVVFDVL
ncbi:YqaE/Pmp3 family membrane protein [Niastella populi]|nr:YqaE/Pmp3 family membrane protein [Niastella populi]